MPATKTRPKAVPPCSCPEPPPPPAPALPAWFREMAEVYSDGISHMFVFHWNVSDYVTPGVDPKGFLELQLGRDRTTDEGVKPGRVIVYYSRASGFTFGLDPDKQEERRERFALAAGLGKGPQTPPGFGAANTAAPDMGAALARYRDPSAALPMLDTALRQKDTKLVVIIDYAESIAPQADWSGMSAEDRTVLCTLLQWAGDEYARFGHPIILLSRNLGDLHTSLRVASSGIHAVQIPSPDVEERLGYIAHCAQRVQEAHPERGDILEISNGEFARVSAGLSKRNIEDVFMRASRMNTPVTAALVKERKREIITTEFEEVIEPWDPDHGFEAIAGYEYVKEFFRRNVIAPLNAGQLARVPMGVLMIGPPGTGKSLMARAVAHECGFNVLKFDPSKIFDKFVGGSERNLSRVFTLVESYTPCILWMDELDQQGFRRSGGDGDGGVSGRTFGMFIDWMSTPAHRGQIMVLAASNRPDLLDAALLRPGRMDRKIPMLAPSVDERALILAYMVGAKLDTLPPEDVMRAIAEQTEGWTGAELEALATKAWMLLLDGRVENVTAALNLAMKVYRPTTRDIQLQTMLAIQECDDLELLPPHLQSFLEDRGKLEAEIHEIQARQFTPFSREEGRAL